jgi:hypothetical protein
VNAAIHLVWRVASEYANRTGDKTDSIPVITNVIWKTPEKHTPSDFRWGSGGKDAAPAPPFYFLKEHDQGSSPSISVKDAKGRTWRVKWGDEVRSETFASRIAWAAGYFVEPSYFLSSGKVLQAKGLNRAQPYVDSNLNFHDARFELDLPDVQKYFDQKSWAWNANPFVGTYELNGLKIVMMLTSNWDNKDVRDSARGSNTAIFFHKKRKNGNEARYMIVDWGGSMGKWGSNILLRTKWDAAGFAQQTPTFVLGVANGYVRWGYAGQRTEDVAEGISVKDVRWLYNWLARITDQELSEALL